MSSITSLLSSTSTTTQSLNNMQQLFTQLDTNDDGTVSKDEFVAGRPDNMSADQASALYDKIDTTGSNALTEQQLADGLQKNKPGMSDSTSVNGNISSDVLALLLQVAQQVGSSSSSGLSDSDSTDSVGSASGSTGTQPSAADIFSQMDTNGDGTVSEDEFVAARPDGVSENQAKSFFSSIDTSGTGSITESQFADALQNNAPPPPPPSASDGSTDSSTTSTSSATGSDTSSTSTSSDAATALLAQILQSIEAYMSQSASVTNASLTSSVSTTI